jgi:hypothetical protein
LLRLQQLKFGDVPETVRTRIESADAWTGEKLVFPLLDSLNKAWREK